jgi:hypothetical protein
MINGLLEFKTEKRHCLHTPALLGLPSLIQGAGLKASVISCKASLLVLCF